MPDHSLTASDAARLQASGYRLTAPRQTMIAALRDAGRYCTAQQLYERLRGRSVGLASVYRTLELLAMSTTETCRIFSTVKANGPSMPISGPAAAQLYRIAQEAVRNAVEHGAASKVLIQLTFSQRDMVLTVQDDGEGFKKKKNGHGMGLRIMRYRAQSIGGSCEVQSGPGKGTTVYCRVPLEAQPSLSSLS